MMAAGIAAGVIAGLLVGVPLYLLASRNLRTQMIRLEASLEILRRSVRVLADIAARDPDVIVNRDSKGDPVSITYNLRPDDLHHGQESL